MPPSLPTLEEQFMGQFYEPAMRNRNLRTNNDRFEHAKRQYEQLHRHQLPVSFATFKRLLYRRR